MDITELALVCMVRSRGVNRATIWGLGSTPTLMVIAGKCQKILVIP